MNIQTAFFKLNREVLDTKQTRLKLIHFAITITSTSFLKKQKRIVIYPPIVSVLTSAKPGGSADEKKQ